jgi:hypothetical protein
MSATLYTLRSLSKEGQIGVAILYSDGHAHSTIWYSSIERARELAATRIFPTGREVDPETWETEWYSRNHPTYYRILQHENGGYYAHIWPYRGGPCDFGLAICDERMVGAFEDEEQLRQEIEQHYRGALPVEGGSL